MQAVSTVDEHPHVISGTPDRDPAMLEAAGPGTTWSGSVGFWVKSPELFTGFGIECHNAGVHRCHVDNIVNHQRGCFEAAWAGAKLLIR